MTDLPDPPGCGSGLLVDGGQPPRRWMAWRQSVPCVALLALLFGVWLWNAHTARNGSAPSPTQMGGLVMLSLLVAFVVYAWIGGIVSAVRLLRRLLRQRRQGKINDS